MALRRSFGSAARRSAARYRPRPVRGRCFVCSSTAHARGALRPRPWAHRVDRHPPRRAAPGVVAVWTAADVADIPPIDFRLTRIEGLDPYRQPILATRSRALCRRAGRRRVRDRPLPRRGCRRSRDGRSRRVARRCLPPTRRPANSTQNHSTEVALVRKGFGDVEAALPPHTRSSRSISPSAATAACRWRRAAPSRGEARGILELHGAAKVLHWNRDAPGAHAWPRALLHAPARRPCRRRLRRTRRALPRRRAGLPRRAAAGRPVKWIEDRREHLLATNHSRQQHFRVRAAVDAQGRLLAIDGEFFHDQGAYVRTHAATVPDLAAAMLPGPYRLAAYRMVGPHPAHQQDAVRHLPRARPLREHVCARATDGCHRGAAECRSGRNPPPQPHRHKPRCRTLALLDTLGTELTYDSGDYAGLLDKALAGDRLAVAAG